MVSLAAFLQSCRVGHFNSTSISLSLTLDVFLCWFKANLAAPCCTFSSLLMSFFIVWIPHHTGMFEDGTHKGQVSEHLDPSCTNLEISLQDTLVFCWLTTFRLFCKDDKTRLIPAFPLGPQNSQWEGAGQGINNYFLKENESVSRCQKSSELRSCVKLENAILGSRP